MKQFCRRIQYYIKKHNAKRKYGEEKLTITGLAKKANVTQSTLSDIMCGVNKHSKTSTLSHIIKPFEIRLTEFFDDLMFEEVNVEPVKPRRKKQNKLAD